MKSSNSNSWLLLLTASLHPTTAKDLTRRRLGNNNNNESQIQRHSLRDSFYDLSSLTDREKRDVIQTAIRMRSVGDSIDWEEQKNKYREAVTTYQLQIHDEAASQEQSIQSTKTNQQRHLQKSIDGDVFDSYEYSTGSCPQAGSLGVPCPPSDLPELCNKYNRDTSSFRACLDACAPAFCCIHDADRELNFLAPNCNTDENCPGYNWCYIGEWWIE
jgi:hypothetical protein